MIMGFKELKQQARQSLQGNWRKSMIVVALTTILSALPSWIEMMVRPEDYFDPTYIVDYMSMFQPSSFGVFSFLWYLLIPGAVVLGLAGFFLHLIRRNSATETDTFEFFTNLSKFGKSVLYNVLITVYVFLWCLLLIVPGIIRSISYAMTPYIMQDHPEYSVNQAISKSIQMMAGYKWQFFLLQLSFLGWIILAICTFGIGLLWVFPYIQATNTHFYEQRKNENEVVKG
ncbi:DUF975 family protein [Thermoactinomyces sp. DSM 45892]|uniref:DUF975 family protein n=1 Tax=Thermoactinomyces sp. DSM 45892 TaxID=1882753 RepID=UPI0008957A6E|nr:DUF975 family protein [Thermoactinomyces sp. DSM 45892]SDZ32364.1 Uncharacterized membrane protein [Thermoactinomyces sp. DSM 45892]